MAPRHAIYFAPEADGALARFANGWLGRDPESGAEIAPPEAPGLAPRRLAAITAEPRRYG